MLCIDGTLNNLGAAAQVGWKSPTCDFSTISFSVWATRLRYLKNEWAILTASWKSSFLLIFAFLSTSERPRTAHYKPLSTMRLWYCLGLAKYRYTHYPNVKTDNKFKVPLALFHSVTINSCPNFSGGHNSNPFRCTHAVINKIIINRLLR